MILQCGLSQPSESTPTDTIASISPLSWRASNFIRSLTGVFAVTMAASIPFCLMLRKVVSATLTSAQNQAEIGFPLVFRRSSL